MNFFFLLIVGSYEVGVYDNNPPTLLLKGNSAGNSSPAVLEYVYWPGTSCNTPESSLLKMKVHLRHIYVAQSVFQKWMAERRNEVTLFRNPIKRPSRQSHN